MTDTDLNWSALAAAVRARRQELSLTQEDVQTHGGPSTAKMREIENGRASTVSTGTCAAIEKALLWQPGSVRRILDGDDAVIADDHAPNRISAGAKAFSDIMLAYQNGLLGSHRALPVGNPMRRRLIEAASTLEEYLEIYGQDDGTVGDITRYGEKYVESMQVLTQMHELFESSCQEVIRLTKQQRSAGR